MRSRHSWKSVKEKNTKKLYDYVCNRCGIKVVASSMLKADKYGSSCYTFRRIEHKFFK